MALKKFTRIGKTGIFERGDDTCEHPRVTLHAPADRVAVADKWLVRVHDPRSRQSLSLVKRSSTFAAKSRREAVRVANSFKFQ